MSLGKRFLKKIENFKTNVPYSGIDQCEKQRAGQLCCVATLLIGF